jgi:arabinogalactan oligomer / maltooligosaccharide transport system permease protein
MKNIPVKILLLIISIILFWGCSAPESENEIVIWHQMRVDEREILERQITEFQKLHPDIKVAQLYKETEELRSGYIVAAIGGQGPDLIYGPSDQVGPFETMRIIKPLDEVFDSTYLNQFNELGLVYSNDQLWMIADKIGNHLTLVYNKDMIDKPPTTDLELIEIGKTINKRYR